jgi:Mg2+-importing ATPase
MSSSSNFGNMLSMTIASIFLPYLPMLPSQILLNNFLYDFSQVALPTDSVDQEYLTKPKPWNINFIKEFMLYIGPISSIFDFATFGIMWYVFHANPALFHTGWFVESLATQVLVVWVIRTGKVPFLQSRPSTTFLLATTGIVAFGIIIPYTLLGKWIGFVPLPLLFFLILMTMVIFYLILVQIVKTWFIRKFGYE